jgi:hypothetical protein
VNGVLGPGTPGESCIMRLLSVCAETRHLSCGIFYSTCRCHFHVKNNISGTSSLRLGFTSFRILSCSKIMFSIENIILLRQRTRTHGIGTLSLNLYVLNVRVGAILVRLRINDAAPVPQYLVLHHPGMGELNQILNRYLR